MCVMPSSTCDVAGILAQVDGGIAALAPEVEERLGEPKGGPQILQRLRRPVPQVGQQWRQPPPRCYPLLEQIPAFTQPETI